MILEQFFSHSVSSGVSVMDLFEMDSLIMRKC
jgi:hypothetical protein